MCRNHHLLDIRSLQSSPSQDEEKNTLIYNMPGKLKNLTITMSPWLFLAVCNEEGRSQNPKSQVPSLTTVGFQAGDQYNEGYPNSEDLRLCVAESIWINTT